MEDIKITVLSKNKTTEKFFSNEKRDIDLIDLNKSKENTSGDKKYQT